MSPVEGQLQPGTQLLGKLRVVRLLGAGGLGAVYEVEHELTKHRRALKLLHPRHRQDPEVVQRFLREASAAGHIGDPHIVETFDAGELPSGEPFLLMEMLSGQPLSALYREAGRLPIGLACDLVAQAAEAVDAAHRAGIVHRDLKPDNLFVTERSGKPFIKVLDFGISKFDSQRTGAMTVTSAGAAMGTPLYMAPEQMRGAHDVDARADVYALGVVLYEGLAGGVPYHAESFAELAALVLAGKAPPVRARRPGVPEALADIVHQALRVAPAERFPSAAALAKALRPLIEYVEPGLAAARADPGDTHPPGAKEFATPGPPGGHRPSDPGLDSTVPRAGGPVDAAPLVLQKPAPVVAPEPPADQAPARAATAPLVLQKPAPVVAPEPPADQVPARAPTAPPPVAVPPSRSRSVLPALAVVAAAIIGGVVVRGLGGRRAEPAAVDAGVPTALPFPIVDASVEAVPDAGEPAPVARVNIRDAGDAPATGAGLADAGLARAATRPADAGVRPPKPKSGKPRDAGLADFDDGLTGGDP